MPRQLADRRPIGAAGGLQFAELAPNRLHFGVKAANDRAGVKLLDHRSQIGGEPLDGRQQIILNASIALRLDAVDKRPQRRFDRSDR